MDFTIRFDDISRLFPAHIIIDDGHCIQAIGPAISRYVPEVRLADAFEDHFCGIDNPTGAPIFEQHSNYLQVKSKHSDFRFHGSIVRNGKMSLLALRISPSVSIFELAQLDISDFPAGDPTVDILLLVSMQNAMLKDAQMLADDLAKERQRSDALLQQISRVSGYLAHDLNNHLSIIRLNCERLRGVQPPNYDQTKVGHISKIIEAAASQSAALARSLMNLTAADRDERSYIDVDRMMRDLEPYLVSLLGEERELRFDLKAQGAKIFTPPAGFINCLTNVFLNARDAITSSGHVGISTTFAELQSDAGHPDEPRDWLSICIEDDGEGMTEAVLALALEPYFTTKGGGTGIGLASVHDFMREEGGKVDLDSSPGGGTRVYLRFPVDSKGRARPPADAKMVGSGSHLDTTPTRIIVVDDEPYALEALGELLEADGYSVTCAESPTAAIAGIEQSLAHGRPFQILLTDVIMPDGCGIELGRAAQVLIPDLHVVLMSGNMPDRSQIHGEWIFLEKPLEPEKLRRTIRRLLRSAP